MILKIIIINPPGRSTDAEIIAELLRRKKPHSYFHFGTSNEMDDDDTIFKTLQCATLLLKSPILLGKVISHFIDIEIVS